MVISIITAIFFTASSYLFYLPLLLMTATGVLKQHKVAYIASCMLSGIAVLMLWVPVVFFIGLF